MFDIIVVGGGPAGLTAALYGARAGKSVLLIEKYMYGGQITYSHKVENYPACPDISGVDFADNLYRQATSFGVKTKSDEVISAIVEGHVKSVATASGKTYEAKTIIFAVGAYARRLGLPGEDALIGAGISFCAVCDGGFYRGRDVAVCGGGNTALGEAIYLSDLCKTVYLIHRRDTFRADDALVQTLATKKNVVRVMESRITSLSQTDGMLSGITVTNNDGTTKDLAVDGLFEAVGYLPDFAPFKTILPLTADGYGDAGEDCTTTIPGVFVAGDCRRKAVRQLTTAVSDGAVSALAACDFIDKQAHA